MAVSLSDLDYTTTKTYDDLTILDEADLDTTYTAFQTYINDTLKDNLVQLAKDSFGASAYTFTSDGVAARTNTLFAKQYGETTYVAGDISIGTTAGAAYAAVDAVNAAISFTPEVAGQYRATFFFTHLFVYNGTSEGRCEVSFRFTDGTTASNAVLSGGLFPATAANAIRFVNPICITKVFNWADTTAKTVTLQYYNRSMTNVTTNQVSATAATGEIYMTVEKI